VKTIAEARALNREKGWHFFDQSTMRFFHSRVESDIVNERYFISSERDIPRQARKAIWELE
jgi:hypothetical protein